MPRSEARGCRSNLPLEKEELENGKSFLFSVDHGKIYVLGIIYYEIQGSDSPSKKEFLAFLYLTQRLICDSL